MPDGEPAYRRVLLKLSGEALMGSGDFGIDPGVMERMAREIAALAESGYQLALLSVAAISSAVPVWPAAAWIG